MGLGSAHSLSQINSKAATILSNRGEIIIRFVQPASISLNALTRMMSIDKYSKNKEGNIITAYLNRNEFIEFEKINIPYEIITLPTLKMSGTMCSDIAGVKNWNCYPTYSQYVQIMQSFAANYPNLCKLDTFGYSIEGRLLLAIKISDYPHTSEEEPAFLYTATMHGDETAGYVLMLRLIDYLLSNYNSNSRISDLLNKTEIWINPLSNPDGTFSGGNSTLTGSTRFNSAGIDLNRNFPDPTGNLHPDGKAWQIENLAMMDFLKRHHFVFAANFHGGAEVVNYPWDTWTSNEKVNADDLWYQEISHEYADTVHTNSTNYMITLDGISNPSGISNGGDWYVVYGGRQDYMNYYLHSRETTIELTGIKTPVASSLPDYWNYNYRSFLNYINRVHTGIYGKITDQDGNPLQAKIILDGYDYDSSEVYSNKLNGMFYRMLSDGNYHLQAILSGYSIADTIVLVQNNEAVKVNLVLNKDRVGINRIEKSSLKVIRHTNPAREQFGLELELEKPFIIELQVYNLSGKKLHKQQFSCHQGINFLKMNIENLKSGIYICKIEEGNFNQNLMFVKIE